jgi:hypothetical protein
MALPLLDAEQLHLTLTRTASAGQAGLAPALLLSSPLPVNSDECGLGVSTALPFLSAADLLTTLHILRC